MKATLRGTGQHNPGVAAGSHTIPTPPSTEELHISEMAVCRRPQDGVTSATARFFHTAVAAGQSLIIFGGGGLWSCALTVYQAMHSTWIGASSLGPLFLLIFSVAGGRCTGIGIGTLPAASLFGTT